MWLHQISCSACVKQASKLVADWSMRWSRDTLLKKLRLYTTCSELVFLGEFNEQSLVILWVSWCKNEGFWKTFTCMISNLKTSLPLSDEEVTSLIPGNSHSSIRKTFSMVGSILSIKMSTFSILLPILTLSKTTSWRSSNLNWSKFSVNFKSRK